MRADHPDQIPLRSVLNRIESGWSPVCEPQPPSKSEWGVLSLGAVTSGSFVEDQAKRLPSTTLCQPALEVKAGDVLVARANGSKRLVGIGCVVPGGVREGLLLSDLIYRLVPDRKKLDPAFLGMVIAAPKFRRQVEGAMRSTSGQFKISKSDLLDFSVPLPSLSVQREVVEFLGAVENLISAESRELMKETLLWEGIVDQKFRDHTREHRSARLADVSRSTGSYGSNAAAVVRDDSLPRYVRITDIDDRGCLSADLSSAVSVPWASGRPYILGEGDLLIARTGFTTGKSYLYQKMDGLCAFAGYLVRFQIDSSVMLPEYAFMWTRANAFKAWVSRNVHEVGQRNISAREYDEHRLPVPPLDTQWELVRAWEAARLAAQIREMEIGRLKLLKQAIADDLLSGKARLRGDA